MHKIYSQNIFKTMCKIYNKEQIHLIFLCMFGERNWYSQNQVEVIKNVQVFFSSNYVTPKRR